MVLDLASIIANAEAQNAIKRLREENARLRQIIEPKNNQAVAEFETHSQTIDFLDAFAYAFKKSVREREENMFVMGFNQYASHCFFDSIIIELRLVDGKYKMIFRNK